MAFSSQEEVSCGPLKHSVSVGVDMDAENLDSDDSLDDSLGVMADLGDADVQASHELQELSYIGHCTEGEMRSACYNAQQQQPAVPDVGGGMNIDNSYTNCTATPYNPGLASASYSTSAPLEQRNQFCASLPCQASGKTCRCSEVHLWPGLHVIPCVSM